MTIKTPKKAPETWFLVKNDHKKSQKGPPQGVFGPKRGQKWPKTPKSGFLAKNRAKNPQRPRRQRPIWSLPLKPQKPRTPGEFGPPKTRGFWPKKEAPKVQILVPEGCQKLGFLVPFLAKSGGGVWGLGSGGAREARER